MLRRRRWKRWSSLAGSLLLTAFVVACEGSSCSGSTEPEVEVPEPGELPAAPLREIVFVAESDTLLDVFGMTGTGTQVVQLTNRNGKEEQLDASFNGAKIVYHTFYSKGGNMVFIMNADGTGRVQLSATDGSANDRNPTISANGQKIAFEHWNSGGRSEIWTVNADGSGRTKVETQAGSAHYPAISPDGSEIVYANGPEGSFRGDLFLKQANGTIIQLTSGGALQLYPRWTPDASRIYFVGADAQDSRDIYWVTPDGKNIGRLTNTPEDEAEFSISPDGQKIVVRAGSDFYLMNIDGSNRTRITPGGMTEIGWPTFRANVSSGPPPRVLTTVRVQPEGPASMTVGENRQFNAAAYDQNGELMTANGTATWTSSNNAVATVNNGMVHAVGAGSAEIFANMEGKTGSVLVQVTAPAQTATVTWTAGTPTTIKRRADDTLETISGMLVVGDHDLGGDHELQGFQPYPVTGIPSGANITKATVTISQNLQDTDGNPFSLGGLYAELTFQNTLNRGTLASGAVLISNATLNTPVTVDITSLVRQAVTANNGFMTLRLRFQTLTNNNGVVDYGFFEAGPITVTYTN